MKSTVLTVVLLPAVAKTLHLSYAGLSSPDIQEISLGAESEFIPKGSRNDLGCDLLAINDSLDEGFPIWGAQVRRAISHSIFKRSDRPSNRPSDRDRLERARARVKILGLMDIPRPSKIPSAPLPKAQPSSEKDRTASRVLESPQSSKIQDARTRVMMFGLSGIPRPSKIPKPSKISRPSKIPPSSLSDPQRPFQRNWMALRPLGSIIPSRIPRLLQNQQVSAPLQHQNNKKPNVSESLQESRSYKISNGKSQDPIVDQIAQSSPPSGRTISRPRGNASLGHVEKATQGTASASILPQPKLDIKNQSKQSAGSSDMESKVLYQEPQAPSLMDVIGTPPGLPKIKVEGDTTGGLYERLVQAFSSGGPYSGAYFKHISMLGSPRAPVSRPPGLPKPPART